MSPQSFMLKKYGIGEDQMSEIHNHRENTVFLEADTVSNRRYATAPVPEGKIRSAAPSSKSSAGSCTRDYQMFGEYF